MWSKRISIACTRRTRGAKPFESAHLPAFVGYGFDPSVGSPLSDEVASVRDALAEAFSVGQGVGDERPEAFVGRCRVAPAP